jgi:REP element-mobilizing transposase RayT
MARPLRLEFAGAIYHLTSRGNARQRVFFTDPDRELFLTTLAAVVRRYDWICHAYCLMANHYHLLIETPKTNLSIGMRQLNGIYTQSFNRRHNRVGHLFQGRFKAILVERESHLLELCRYIVLNPARVKGSATTSSWKWSSYRATAGLVSVPEFLHTDWILEQFGKTRSRAQQQYREFVRDGITSRPWDDLKGQIYLGSEAFIEKHTSRKKDIKEIPRAQLRAAKPSLEKIFGRKGEKAIGEAYEQGYRLNEIAAHLGVHYATVSRRLKRIEQTS